MHKLSLLILYQYGNFGVRFDLQIHFKKFEPFQASILKDLAESAAIFPALEVLGISWDYSCLPGGKLSKLYEAYLSVHRFISKHHQTLRSVEMDFSHLRCCGSFLHRTVILDQSSEGRYKDLLEAPVKSTFCTLMIGFPTHEGEHPWNLCKKK